MLARVAFVAIAIALGATACGGGGNAQRSALTAYLNEVNTTESQLATPLKAVAKANQAFAKQQSSAKAQAQLVKAEQTLRKLEHRLAAIKPPPDAQHLQALLLEVVAREISLTQELYSLGTFVPRFEAALQPLAAAGTALKHELGRTAKGASEARAVDADKAVALRSYTTTLDGVMARLRALQPPAVWRPTYKTQVTSLEQLRSSSTALAVAIEGNHAATVPGLLRAFDAAAVSDQSLSAQRAQIAAVAAYNRRVQSIADLARSIDQERNRLQRVTR
jgi:hypothetical protein